MTIWYQGLDDVDITPRSEWTPNAEENPPRTGDFYVNMDTGLYWELIQPEPGRPKSFGDFVDSREGVSGRNPDSPPAPLPPYS